MPKCCVNKCKNNTLSVLKKHGVSYFRFPGNEIIKERWRKIIAKERNDEYFKPNLSNVVCSDHFFESDMYYTKTGMRKLTKKALPKKGMQEDKISHGNESKTQKSTLVNTNTFQLVDVDQCRPEVYIIKEELKTDEDILIEEREMTQQPITKDIFELSTGQSEPLEVVQAELRTGISPTSSEITSFINTPEIDYYKRRMLVFERKLDLKIKEVNNLKKRNKRLILKNSSLKKIIQTLKKKIPKC